MYRKIIPLIACIPLNAQAATAEKPNVLIILADDLGWSDIGCYGSEINTPNLDKLAKDGLRFNNFHNTGKSFPSRSCLLTGLYAQQNGYNKLYNKPFKNAVTLGEVLKSAGYRTLFAGKHHGAENPHDMGFDRNFGLKDGCCNYFNPGVTRPGEGEPAHKIARKWCIDEKEYEPYTPAEKDFYTTDYYTNYALDWLEEYANEDKPFFLYLAYNAPHDPLQAWPEDIAKYKGKYDCGYEPIREARYKKQQKLGIIDEKWVLTEPTHVPWSEVTPEEQAIETRRMEVYAAMIDRLDQNIGRVIKYLKKSKELDNTLVIFMSDNGGASEIVHIKNESGRTGEIGSMTRWESIGPDWANVANTPYRYYKSTSYEGGINTPMIINWKDGLKAKGEVTSAFGHFIDIMPTLCEITGATYPTEYDGDKITPMSGESLKPVIDGDRSWKRSTPLYWEWAMGAAVGDGEWKIVRPRINSDWSLHNIVEDPCESKDLSKSNPEQTNKMDEMFKAWKKSLGME